jgi:hypothetical protein
MDGSLDVLVHKGTTARLHDARHSSSDREVRWVQWFAAANAPSSNPFNYRDANAAINFHYYLLTTCSISRRYKTSHCCPS